jgi:hypothetical protein
MSKLIDIQGSLTVNDTTCSSSSSSSSRILGFGQSACGDGRTFEAAVCESRRINSVTPVDLDALNGLTSIEFLYLLSSASMTLRLFAIPAIVTAVGGTYPTGFSGGETLTVVMDGVSVVTTFLVGDQTVTQVANRINAAMALAGIAAPRVTVVNGQLYFTGLSTKVDGLEGIITFSGATTTQLGLDSPTSANALGQDIPFNGLWITEFRSYPDAPTKIQIYGDATVDVVAAGKST